MEASSPFEGRASADSSLDADDPFDARRQHTIGRGRRGLLSSSPSSAEWWSLGSNASAGAHENVVAAWYERDDDGTSVALLQVRRARWFPPCLPSG